MTHRKIENLTIDEKKDFINWLKFSFNSMVPTSIYENKEEIASYVEQSNTKIEKFFTTLHQCVNEQEFFQIIEREKKDITEYFQTHRGSIHGHTVVIYLAFKEAFNYIEKAYPNIDSILNIISNQRKIKKLQSLVQGVEDDVVKLKNINAEPNFRHSHSLNTSDSKSHVFPPLTKWVIKKLETLGWIVPEKNFEVSLPVIKNSIDIDWQKKAHIEFKKLTDDFGFKKIFIEGEKDWKDIATWAGALHQTITDVMKDFGLPNQAASLNSEMTLSYNPKHLQQINATGAMLGNYVSNLSIEFSTPIVMKQIFIHEYTHAIDRLAGIHYYRLKQPHFMEDYAIISQNLNKSSLFLSQQILEDMLNFNPLMNEVLLSDDGTIKMAQETMAKMFGATTADNFAQNQNIQIEKIITHIKHQFVAQCFKNTQWDWLTLPKEQQQKILGNFYFNEAIHLLIKTSVDKPSFNDTQLNNINHTLSQHLVKSFDSLLIPQYQQHSIIEKIQNQTLDNLNNIQAIFNNYGFTFLQGFNHDTALLAQGHIAKKSLIYGNNSTAKESRQYYVKPLEMLARHVEVFYTDKIKPELAQIYPLLNYEEKNNYKTLLQKMVIFSGIATKNDIHDTEKLESTTVIDNRIHSLRQKNYGKQIVQKINI